MKKSKVKVPIRIETNQSLSKELKASHEAIIESEERFRQTFMQAAVGLTRVSIDGKFLVFNQRLCDIVGYTREELQQLTFQDITYPEDLQKDLDNVKKMLNQELERFSMEKRYIRKDSSLVWVNLTVSLVRDNKNKPKYFISVIEDINARKRAEEALKASEERFRLMIEKNKSVISILDKDGNRVFTTPSVKSVLGYDSYEFLGKASFLKIHTEDIPNAKKILTEVKKQPGISIPYLQRVQHKNGSWVWVEGIATNLLHEPSVRGIVLNYSDVTERIEHEKSKDEFIGIASHELKTPITSIKAYCQVLQTIFKRKGDVRAVESLQKMDVQVDKLTSLIADLLDVTKFQSGKIQFQEDFFDFNELINEIVDEMQLTTEKHTLRKTLDKTKSIYGDRDRIGQVLTNLISNAIKYSPHAHIIDITTTVNTKNITLCVRDYGVGIPKEKQDKVFEQFFRVNGPKHKTIPGLGLGLYISSEIIKRQGGNIWVKSTEGNGSTFCFMLPLKRNNQKNRRSTRK